MKQINTEEDGSNTWQLLWKQNPLLVTKIKISIATRGKGYIMFGRGSGMHALLQQLERDLL